MALLPSRARRPDAPFVDAGTVVAVDAPFPGGGVTGAQLATVARTWAAGREIQEIRAKSPEVGAVETWSGAISVGDADNEYYGNYVARDSAEELVVFLEVQVGAGSASGE